MFGRLLPGIVTVGEWFYLVIVSHLSAPVFFLLLTRFSFFSAALLSPIMVPYYEAALFPECFFPVLKIYCY